MSFHKIYPILIDILEWMLYPLLSGYFSVSVLLEQWFYYFDFQYSNYYLILNLMICSSFRFHLILISLQNVLVNFFFFAQSDIQFLSSSTLLNIVWFSTQVLIFLSTISFIINILFIKNDWKKWIPIKFDIRVTNYVVI